MPRTKKTTDNGGWTSEVARALVDDYSQRRRQNNVRSLGLVQGVERDYPHPLRRIRAITALHGSGDVTLDHYLEAVQRWAAEGEQSSTPELNVINWAKALCRATTEKQRARAERMLGRSVEQLGSA